jgi:hypothetical protein
MPRTPRLSPSLRRQLFTAFAIFATAAQLVVALLPLTEGRNRTMASHVESGSTKGHYAHDDTKCPSCQARSIHGTPQRAEPPIVVVRLGPANIGRGPVRAISNDHLRHTQSRAPPFVI